jgi:hypothetical protein
LCCPGRDTGTCPDGVGRFPPVGADVVVDGATGGFWPLACGWPLPPRCAKLKPCAFISVPILPASMSKTSHPYAASARLKFHMFLKALSSICPLPGVDWPPNGLPPLATVGIFCTSSSEYCRSRFCDSFSSTAGSTSLLTVCHTSSNDAREAASFPR